MSRSARGRARALLTVALAVSALTACVPAQPHRNLIDSRSTLPPTHIGEGGAVMLGRTADVGAWEVTVVETDLAPREGPPTELRGLTADERRRIQPFLIALRVGRTADTSAHLRDTLTFQGYTSDGSRFKERTTAGRCAERTGEPERFNPEIGGDETLDVVVCLFVSLRDWDNLFLAVRDAESGDARGFRLQATSH